MANLAGMKQRLRDLEQRRGALLLEIENRNREIAEIERDARLLALAIDEIENPDEPAPPAEVK